MQAQFGSAPPAELARLRLALGLGLPAEAVAKLHEEWRERPGPPGGLPSSMGRGPGGGGRSGAQRALSGVPTGGVHTLAN
jgi:hypothetical protein